MTMDKVTFLDERHLVRGGGQPPPPPDSSPPHKDDHEDEDDAEVMQVGESFYLNSIEM